MMGTREEAEDALQNSFVDVFRRMESFRGESTLGAWIKRIVINSCLDLLKRRKWQLVEAGPELHLVEDQAYENDFAIEDLDRIKLAIQSLPAGYKIVFNLYLLEGYDHSEISEILGITEGASKSQYSRAKKKLHQILTKEQI